MKIFYLKKGLLCLLLCTAFLLGASAATLEEMWENGVVSDDGIRHGDMRDGEVSDVSEPKQDGVLGDIVSEGESVVDDLFGGSAPETTAQAPETTPRTTARTTAGTDATTAQGATAGDGGMSMGIIIAILVVIAVVAIIFMLLPKRK